MAKVSRHSGRSSGSDSSNEASLLQWFVSFFFWGQLMVAGVLYGCVAMAPKLSTYVELDGEYVTAQTELVSLRS